MPIDDLSTGRMSSVCPIHMLSVYVAGSICPLLNMFSEFQSTGHVDSMHFRLLLTAIRIAPDLNGSRRLCFVYRCFFLVSLLVLFAGYHREVAHAFIHTHSEPFGRHLWARYIVRRFSPAKIKPADVDGVIYAPRIKALSQNAASSIAPNCTVTKTYNSKKQHKQQN